MHDIDIVQASLSCRWILDRMATALPGPGTAPFAELIRRLHPYGITPQDVSVETLGNRLSDVAISIALLQGQVNVRITCSGFELIVPRLFDDLTARLPEHAEIVLEALRHADIDVEHFSIRIGYSCHAQLKERQAGAWIASHFHAEPASQTLVPDAFGYQIQPPDRPDVLEMRLVAAKSKFFSEALFLELSFLYADGASPSEMALRAQKDYDYALACFGLRRFPGGPS